MRKPKVGEELFLLDAGNRVRYKKKGRICKVMKVGRKYFSVEDPSGLNRISTFVEFHITNWVQKSDYTPDYLLLESENAFKDRQEREQIIKEIRKVFDFSSSEKFSLKQLQQIKEILKLGGG